MRFLPIIVCLLLFACTQEKEEVVNFDDLTSKSDYKENEEDKKPKEVVYYDSLDFLSQTLIDSLEFDKKSVFPLDSVFFSDRFGAKKTDKWYYKSDQDSLVFFHWEFKDSIKTFNTFYNWLDCYGNNCTSFHVGQAAKFSKRGTLFLLQDKHLFFIESQLAINYERLLEILDNSKWNKKWKYLVYQAPRKKANWMSRSWDEKTKKNIFVNIIE